MCRLPSSSCWSDVTRDDEGTVLVAEDLDGTLLEGDTSSAPLDAPTLPGYRRLLLVCLVVRLLTSAAVNGCSTSFDGCCWAFEIEDEEDGMVSSEDTVVMDALLSSACISAIMLESKWCSSSWWLLDSV